MSGMAQGAVDSLLGRLAALLVDEAQLLGGVRGDVEFIKDEMESMNSLLLHLTEAQHRAHHVRTWMKQVVGLARDCECYVELYVRHVGIPDPAAAGGGCCLLRSLRLLIRLLRTVPARHQVATRIRELKVRVRDVGDRRLRYGVTVPESAVLLDNDAPRAAAGEEDDLRRRVLLDCPTESLDETQVVRNGVDTVVKWLSVESASRDSSDPRMRVLTVIADLWEGSSRILLGKLVAKGVYVHPYVESSFGCKALLTCGFFDDVDEIRARILEHFTGVQTGKEGKEELTTKLEEHLKGKRFLIVFDGGLCEEVWEGVASGLLHVDGSHGSAIIRIQRYKGVDRLLSSRYKSVVVENSVAFFIRKAEKLLGGLPEYLIYLIERLLYPSAFAIKMLLHLLYVTTEEEIINYNDAIDKCKRLNKSIAKQMLMFCYNELPSNYRSCLMYLTIFRKGQTIRATSLVRRWIAEGLIATTKSSYDTENATDDAHHYMDVLFTRGFVAPVDISAAGDIKSFTVHDEVREFITKIARDVSFADTHLAPDLAQHLSIHSRIGLRKSSHHSDAGIVDFLPTMAGSSQWQLMKVLDLEGCRGLTKHHLRSICKILLLKYLSLRNTDVTGLPKQMKQLQCLETLDIRETKVPVLAKKAIVLPLLKYFLAGQKISSRNDASICKESFPTVHIPLGIQRMENLEILSHVQVSNCDRELSGISQLLKLRKLGVALHGENAKMSDLFHQIEKLHRCLRSLSIRIHRPAGPDNHGAGTTYALTSLPQFIESLNVCGITTGLSHLIQDHHHLVKVTLSETFFKEIDLSILGKLCGLRCLRLQHKSYSESVLTFNDNDFPSLKFLLVQRNDITNISFLNGTAPKLQRIIWYFATSGAISGINNLPCLRNLELNGNCNNLDQVREEISSHPNHPVLKLINPHNESQEDGTTAVAMMSSPP